MAISINWPTGVINIPRDDLTLIQSTPTEIRELDINWFRLTLKDLEDNPDGMPFPKTHQHNTEVEVGGLTLARVVEILPPYTITFEDGQYAVNLVGANSNIGDRVNVNQVSIRPQNSAGLITTIAIENGEFNEKVTIDPDSPNTGTIYPTGTQRKPVNNVADAVAIAHFRGFDELFFQRSISIGLGDDITWDDLKQASRTNKRLKTVKLELLEVDEIVRGTNAPIPFTEVDGKIVEEPEFVKLRAQASEVFHQAVFNRVVGNHHQPAPTLHEGHEPCHIAVGPIWHHQEVRIQSPRVPGDGRGETGAREGQHVAGWLVGQLVREDSVDLQVVEGYPASLGG